MPARFVPVLTPQGRLTLVHADDAPEMPAALAQKIEESFGRGHGHGLLQLGAGDTNGALPSVFGYWREFAARYVTAVCTLPDIASMNDAGALPPIPPPADAELDALAAVAPPMMGAEYLTTAALRVLWNAEDTAFRAELSESKVSIQQFLHGRNPAWNLVGRVHFNLAENRRDPEAPFAFLATYTTQLSAAASAQHLPLGKALSEYAGAKNKSRLLSLLMPVQRAAERCPWLKAMVDEGEIYHPLRWTPKEAFRFLSDQPLLEAAGIVVRVPAVWRANRPPRPRVSAAIGGKPPSGIGADALLDFRMEVTLDGEPLTEAEIARLLAASEGLHLLRGRWVEVDGEQLSRMLDQFRAIEKAAAGKGLSFTEAIRLLAGADVSGDETAVGSAAAWSGVAAGPWLAKTLEELRRPEARDGAIAPDGLNAALRPYQQAGVRWLRLLAALGLGACLADDMGLGKTMQVLALLLLERHEDVGGPRASLLVAPASLLANWVSEIERFAPTLKVLVAHPSAMPVDDLHAINHPQIAGLDLVITSYGTLARTAALLSLPWRLAILDEAQAIKNPAAQQTRTVKQLDAGARIALTGTPVENRLGDLWSIFDFINPGLLGSSKEFSAFAKRLAERTHNPYGPLRDLVRPYILRRLKTDKTVITDLPEKTEVHAFCHLTRKQAALYEQAVGELTEELERSDGIQRRGLILAFLMRFKQICNHPSQWLGGPWDENGSGKLARLREVAETIASRQEKALVFTQFREAAGPLAAFLESLCGRPVLVLHGQTPVKHRGRLVERFQEDEGVSFFVLSLKAGGTGLNLTAASHVIHFDRWWNPAVENQATDRAFRIGQKKNVLVQKFVCKGTVEEKIDCLIESKRRLSQDLLEGGAELQLTEMSDRELLKLVALDIHAASEE